MMEGTWNDIFPFPSRQKKEKPPLCDLSETGIQYIHIWSNCYPATKFRAQYHLGDFYLPDRIIFVSNLHIYEYSVCRNSLKW